MQLKIPKNLSITIDRRAITGFFVVLAGALFFGLGQLFSPPTIAQLQSNQSDNQLVEASKNEHRRWLDGVLLEEQEVSQRPFAVIIDNHRFARPQSALSKASLVFESPVEGGITRFMAVFDARSDINVIGPVRSARPYFLDWAEELDADYAHVGGSPEALELIRVRRLYDVDEFGLGRFFWRSGKRNPPHNTYTSTELLTKAREEMDRSTTSTVKAWWFKDDPPEDERGDGSQPLVIDYSIPLFRVEWRYFSGENKYRRFVNGLVVEGNDQEPIFAKNIAVLWTETAVLDNKGRLRLRTLGSGKAVVAQDGKIIEGEWRKLSREERLRFYNKEGKEIIWTAGNTWIQVVNGRATVTYE